MPHGQSVLSGNAGEVVIEEGETAGLIASKAKGNAEGSWSTRWSKKDCKNLLQDVYLF